MQALIDFEGWRKWRGFNDNPLPTPLAAGHTSPMHTGSHSHGHEPVTTTKPPSPVSPSLSTRNPVVNKDLVLDGVGVGVKDEEGEEDSPRLPVVAPENGLQEKDFGPVDESQGQ